MHLVDRAAGVTLPKPLHVVVLGAGISGLSSAVLLRRAGCSVTLVSADPVEATTSHLAAAVWFPTAPPATPTAFVSRCRWSRCRPICPACSATPWRPGVGWSTGASPASATCFR